MATISSTLRIVEQISAPIKKSIDAMNRLIDVMEKVNQTADLPNMENAFTEVRTEISLAEHALDQFNDELRLTDNHADSISRLSGGFGGFSRAVIVANQGLQLTRQTLDAISRFGEFSDRRTGVDARLNLINDGLRTQEQLESQVMSVATQTRSRYEDTASLIARMGRQDYFKGSNDAALAFAKTMNQALVVSGASTSEVSSVLTQLSQGIASGVLRGEEFNSVMENGSVIADMMATSLGVTKGKLREMAEDGQLTTDVVVSAIMQQASIIDEQFNSMPVTFGQAMTQMDNRVSDLMNVLSQPGMAIDIIIQKITELDAWLNTAQGQAFFTGMANGITTVIEGIMWLAALAGNTYEFFANNWSTIEPIMWGVAAAVGGLTAAFLIYKSIITVLAIVEQIQAAAKMLSTGATIAQTAAQWGLNAALLACPLTWIVVAIMAVIGVIVALTLWIMDLWKTNIDFRVGVIGIWNEILGFFDQVPIFFMGVGYGIADAFSYAKVTTMNILDGLVNGVINRINWLIDKVNNIPGVSISTLDAVSFGAETAIEEEAARAARAANFSQHKAEAALKAVQRELQLTGNEVQWRAEAVAREQNAREQQAANDSAAGNEANPYEFPPVQLAGGTVDKVGKIGSEVDISRQSLEYLNDIAELQVLGGFNNYTTVAYQQMDELRLSPADADILRSSVGADTNIYYLNYSGGVNVKNDIQQGMNLDDIKQRLYDETEAEIECGISFVEEAVNG